MNIITSKRGEEEGTMRENFLQYGKNIIGEQFRMALELSTIDKRISDKVVDI